MLEETTSVTTPSIPRLAACPIFGYAAFAALVAFGCGSDPGAVGDRVPAGPAVTIVDSVLLDENDRFYLGNPFSLVVDTADGSFFISDFFENRILRYARDGRLRLRDYAAGVTKSSRIRKAADDPASTRQSRMKSTASRIRLSRLSSSGRP